MSESTTRGIRIQVRSSYVPERSLPRENYYFFAYTVRISNVGEVTARLESRKWIITNSEGKAETVEGPGVVGQHPVLTPGESFEYTSYCPLRTEVGTMHGLYNMVTSSGERFEATIAPFSLAVPSAVN